MQINKITMTSERKRFNPRDYFNRPFTLKQPDDYEFDDKT